jgi:hypothetical protein
MKLIIDAQTGTILNVDNCYVVDTEDLPNEDSLDTASDSEIAEIAEKYGTAVWKIGEDTGWGDNKYRWCVSYSPKSIHEEAEGYLDGSFVDESDDEYKAVVWLTNDSTQQQREELSRWIVSNYYVWDEYKSNLLTTLVEYHESQVLKADSSED